MAGLFDQLESGFTNPLFLGGIGLATNGFSGLQNGMTTGAGFSADRRKRQESDAAKMALQSRLATMPNMTAEDKAFLSANPDEGLSLLHNIYAERFDPNSEFKRKQQAAELEMLPLKTQLLKAQIDATGRRAEDNNTPAARAKAAAAYGLDPNSEIGRQYILTGNIPQKTSAPVKSKEETERNIAAGLQGLADLPGRYSDNTFESSVGTYQGDNESIGGTIARSWGSLTNALGDANTSEVRNRIAGDTEALAAAIKPLIRSPGEGAWTDADQARLVAVVGNLAQSNTKDEYARNLEAVRQRLSSNFGLNLPPVTARSTQSPQTTQRPMQFNPGRSAAASPYAAMSDAELMKALGQ